MTIFEYCKKSIYIDERLRNEICKNIIPQLLRKDKDVVFIVDGKERSGKSKFADMLGAYISSEFKNDFNVGNFCMTSEEFKFRVMSAKKNEVVVYDEAHRGMGSRRALSEINHILVNLMMEMGQKNLCIIIVLPTFFMLDKYPALYRAKGLFHIYEKKGKRGFWVYYNEKNKLKLYIKGKKLFDYDCMKYPKFRGRFSGQYFINEEEYRQKKARTFNESPQEEFESKYLIQRNLLIYGIYKTTKISQTQMVSLLSSWGVNITQPHISEIVQKVMEKQGKGIDYRLSKDSIYLNGENNEKKKEEKLKLTEEKLSRVFNTPVRNNAPLNVGGQII